MADQDMANGALSDVLITEAVAVTLHAHLAEQGRNVGGPADLAMLLHRAVERTWGTNKAPRFNDKAGGGWVIDLSDYLNGEMLYAQIRTVHGRRTLVTVVEADEYERFMASGEWQTPAAINPEAVLFDPDAIAEAETIESGKLPAPVAAGSPQSRGPQASGVGMRPEKSMPQRNDRMLVVVRSNENEMPPSGDFRVCKRSEVPGLIRELLMGEGITEENIEIWSNPTKPKVKVEF